MMVGWLDRLIATLAQAEAVALVMVLTAKGSTPREAGAFMVVSDNAIEGTIGGGTLEFDAMKLARQKIAQQTGAFSRSLHAFALGPDLGQCCGGHVTVLYEIYQPETLPALRALQDSGATYHNIKSQELPTGLAGLSQALIYEAATGSLSLRIKHPERALYIYGAGHVGRALVSVTHDLGLHRIWVDDSPARFPQDAIAEDITIVPAADMAAIAHYAPPGAYHIILSYSHKIDEAICLALLKKQDFGRLGLIGSASKNARFKKRLATAGIPDEVLARLICPIGLPEIKSKAPPYVALSIAGQIAAWLGEDS